MVVRRTLSIIPIVLVASFLVFCLEVFLPGDTAVNLAGPDASPTRIEEIRRELNLDEPLITRFVDWVGDAAQGDLGRSLFTRRSVADEIVNRWVVTVQLVVGAMVVAIAVGVPFGIVAAVRRDGWIDRLLLAGAAFGASIPAFLLGMFLMAVFSIWLEWLPVAGYVPFSRSTGGWARSMVLPVIALSALVAAELTRQIRSAMIEALEQDYARTARAKGLREHTVVLKHGLRLAAQPAIAVIGVQAARLFGGAVIVEQVFALPGLGRYTIDAITNRDLPVLQGIVPLTVAIAVVLNLGAELAQTALNPRLRAQRSS